MKFNWKVILLGGLAYYVGQFLFSLVTAPFIHEGVLVEPYMAHMGFWRPELAQDPPDMAALMPRWITVGVICAMLQVAVFDNIRSAFTGGAIVKGVKFGLIAFLFYACFAAGWSGIFNLPDAIWFWWSVEALLIFVVGGAVMGFTVGKISSS